MPSPMFSSLAEQLVHPFCKGSQIKCCGEFRCEPCHFRHLKQSHSPVARYFIATNPGPIGPVMQAGPAEEKEKGKEKKKVLSVSEQIDALSPTQREEFVKLIYAKEIIT